MTGLIAGVLPVFLMIALGYGLRKSGFLPDEAWRPIEKLSINIFYPSFLIPAIWHADLAGGGATVAGASAVGATLIVAAAAYAAIAVREGVQAPTVRPFRRGAPAARNHITTA